jgi:serine/threonine-protein phosphatase 2A activator
MEEESHNHHHHHEHHNTPNTSQSQSPPTTGTCCKCGGPTTFAPPPVSPSFSEISPPPTYRPIRAPAIPPDPNTQRAIMLAPVPQPQHVPIASPPFHFQIPIKRIQTPDDIRRFHDSDSGKNFVGFIVALSESFRSRKISDPCHQSETTNTIVSIIETLTQWIDEIPPAQQAARYGNIAYRTWHERLVNSGESLMFRFLPENLRDATVEIVPYFSDSFGNSSRIDYGTGHETNFAAWLYCLARLGVIGEEDYQAVVSRVFVKYLDLMRKLQLVYCLEPAGSHGVWGLDDYHFMPFIFGSSQLIDHKYMKPKSIHNRDILDNFSNEYLYLGCICFVMKVKKGHFAEHSPMLDDISGVPNWKKVNSGLLKMYKAEVLEKVPIMQHFLFGSLIKWYVFNCFDSFSYLILCVFIVIV